ncbi:MAG TPA: Spx/MgsR family RNA polymerase-binding regulatory protein [Bryobacteraceae bacterium]|nr:Spx/MgsR family RNA polymerase-binding regulatory protein [Bryobacteraceae bacterium]
MLHLYLKPTCTTCRKAKSFLRDKGAKFEETDLNAKLTVAQLEDLIGARDYRQFLNTRNELYRERGMKSDPPSREEALQLMAVHPNLIKRPILVKGRQIVLGFDAEAIEKLI